MSLSYQRMAVLLEKLLAPCHTDYSMTAGTGTDQPCAFLYDKGTNHRTDYTCGFMGNKSVLRKAS